MYELVFSAFDERKKVLTTCLHYFIIRIPCKPVVLTFSIFYLCGLKTCLYWKGWVHVTYQTGYLATRYVITC